MAERPSARPAPRPSSGARTLSSTGEPVLSTRFAVPVLPPTFVRRTRLTSRLADGVSRPLTLVNGPAGAGKTLCVADWLGHEPVPGPAVWLTTERGDGSPGTFWAYVLEAMRHRGLSLPNDIGSPVCADEVDGSLPARLAAYLNARTDPVVLVLDEFERAASPRIADQLEFVVRHAGRGLRLVLIGRTEPPLPLHRWRAADEVAEIRAAALAFDPRETTELLARHGLGTDRETVRTLTERTEGWAAGVRLCAMAMAQSGEPDRFLADFEAGHGPVADFLLAEVLGGQSAEAQELLLRASVLERVHPGLANALTGRENAERILAELERANAFVTAVGHSWYRLHPLFAEVLRVRMRSRCPGLEPELRRTAARWLCEAGHLSAALAHSTAAGDWEVAAEQVVGSLAVGRLFTGAGTRTPDAHLADMPSDVPGAAPNLVRATRSLARYDVAAALVQLRTAEEELRRGSRGGVRARLSLALLRAMASRLLGSADMAEAAALEAEKYGRLVPAEQLESRPELPALLLTSLGAAELWAGRLDAAREALSAAVDLPDRPATADPRHEALGRIALIDFLRGWYRRAEASARAAVSVAERAGLPLPRRSGIAHLVLAALAVERDALGAARADLRRATLSAGAGDDPVVLSGIAILNSRLLLAEGDTEASLHVLSGADDRSRAGVRSPWVGALLALAEATADLARGDPRAALDVLDASTTGIPEFTVIAARARLAQGDGGAAIDILDSHPAGPGWGPSVTARTVLARAEAAGRLGDVRTAQRLTLRALDLARPEQLRRPFLEAGPWLGRALHGRPVPADAWLPAAIAGNGPAEATGASRATVVEPLSDRERDVLRQVAQLKSTEEVAADLFLSVNTVKTHLKNIFRKLGANRRGEAVRLAQELDLL